MSELSGKKFDTEKVDMDLLSPYAIEKVAQVMTYGKQKYGRDNWRGGIVFSRLLAAVLRHINAYRKGETYDPETGLSHLSHASCGLMMLLEFEETRPELDDRALKETKKPVDATELYHAGQKAQEEVKQMVATTRLILNANQEVIADLVKLEKPKTKFSPGDVVKHVNNDSEATVQAVYYTETGKAVLLVRDADHNIFGVDPNSYKGIYASN